MKRITRGWFYRIGTNHVSHYFLGYTEKSFCGRRMDSPKEWTRTDGRRRCRRCFK